VKVVTTALSRTNRHLLRAVPSTDASHLMGR